MRFVCPFVAQESFAGASTSKSRGLRALLSEAGYHLAGSGLCFTRQLDPCQRAASREAAPRRHLALAALAAVVALAMLGELGGLATAAVATATDDPPESVLSLPIFYIDSAGLQDATLRAIKDEVTAQLAEIGVSVMEIDPEGMSAGLNVPEGLHLGVMLLGPTKDGWGHGRRTIGISTREEPKRGYNTVYIFVPEVENTLGVCSVRPFPQVVGKGAGRAAVHEIIHTLIPALEHAEEKTDLMAPSWSCNALLKDGIGLNAEFAEAVRTKLAELIG